MKPYYVTTMYGPPFDYVLGMCKLLRGNTNSKSIHLMRDSDLRNYWTERIVGQVSGIHEMKAVAIARRNPKAPIELTHTHYFGLALKVNNDYPFLDPLTSKEVDHNRWEILAHLFKTEYVNSPEKINEELAIHRELKYKPPASPHGLHNITPNFSLNQWVSDLSYGIELTSTYRSKDYGKLYSLAAWTTPLDLSAVPRRNNQREISIHNH